MRSNASEIRPNLNSYEPKKVFGNTAMNNYTASDTDTGKVDSSSPMGSVPIFVNPVYDLPFESTDPLDKAQSETKKQPWQTFEEVKFDRSV